MERKGGRGAKRPAATRADDALMDDLLPDLLPEEEAADAADAPADDEAVEGEVEAPVASPAKKGGAPAGGPSDREAGLDAALFGMAADVPVQVVAVLGKRTLTMREALELTQGEVIDLGRPPHTVVDLVANGKLIAKGELVEIDGKLGVRIVKMVR